MVFDLILNALRGGGDERKRRGLAEDRANPTWHLRRDGEVLWSCVLEDAVMGSSYNSKTFLLMIHPGVQYRSGPYVAALKRLPSTALLYETFFTFGESLARVSLPADSQTGSIRYTVGAGDPYHVSGQKWSFHRMTAIHVVRGLRSFSPRDAQYSELDGIYAEQQKALVKRVTETQQVAQRAAMEREYWFALSGRDFEIQLASLLNRSGWQAMATPLSGDGGVDIIATRADASYVIQCKAHRDPVGPAIVRELLGARADRHGGANMILVALGGLTSGAADLAERNAVDVWTVEEVVRLAKGQTASM